MYPLSFTTKQKVGMAVLISVALLGFIIAGHFDFQSISNGTLK